MNVADHAGSQWLTCFQETGMEILGKSADELGELRDQVREREVRLTLFPPPVLVTIFAYCKWSKTGGGEWGFRRLPLNKSELFFLYVQDEASYDQVFQQTYFKEYIFKLRAKMDTFNVRNITSVISLSSVTLAPPLQLFLSLSLTHSLDLFVGWATSEVLCNVCDPSELCPGDKEVHWGNQTDDGAVTLAEGDQKLS